MAHLDRIRIAGFKSIRDQQVELRPLNVLIGANGSGKSNFIGVFRLLHEIVRGRLQLLWRATVVRSPFFTMAGRRPALLAVGFRVRLIARLGCG